MNLRIYLVGFLLPLAFSLLAQDSLSHDFHSNLEETRSELIDSDNDYENLIDSLAYLQAPNEKIMLALQIAQNFKDDNWDRCLHYINVAEKNILDCNSDSVLIRAFSEIGDIFYSKDLLDVALKYYTNAYNLFPTESYSMEKSAVENDIAIIYARLQKTEKAFYFFHRIGKYSENNHDTLSLVKVYNNLGILYFDVDVDSSIFYFKKSLDIVDKIKDPELSVYVFTNNAKCYAAKEEPEKTKFYLNKAVQLIDEISVESKVWLYSTIAKDFLERQQLDSSIMYATKALSLMNGAKYTFAYKNLLEVLSKAYLQKEEWENASKTFAAFELINDSLNVEQKAVNAEKIKFQQEFLIDEQKRLLEDHKKKEYYLIIGFSLVSGLFILLVLLIINKNRLQKSNLEKQLIEAKKEELNADLDSKKRMLIAKAMKEINRAEFVQDILADLKEIKLKAVKKETQASIDIIQQRLQKDTSNSIWEEFELSLSQVHEAFFTNLDKKHPDLTSKDKRLCALLVLNLSSKEIAQITGQDFKTVENARTRLRKKLNLTNTKIDLTTYLNSLK